MKYLNQSETHSRCLSVKQHDSDLRAQTAVLMEGCEDLDVLAAICMFLQHLTSVLPSLQNRPALGTSRGAGADWLMILPAWSMHVIRIIAHTSNTIRTIYVSFNLSFDWADESKVKRGPRDHKYGLKLTRLSYQEHEHCVKTN